MVQSWKVDDRDRAANYDLGRPGLTNKCTKNRIEKTTTDMQCHLGK